VGDEAAAILTDRTHHHAAAFGEGVADDIGGHFHDAGD
jgi:hypothetical protein